MSLFNNQNKKERFLWQQDESKSNDCQRESRNQNNIDLQGINENPNQERQKPYLCRRCGRPCSFRIPSFRIPCSFGSPCPCPRKRPCSYGRPGPTGPTGADGLSAYLVAVEAGYTGTLEEWLSDLVGPTGATGADGLSAYQVAVEAGYTGTLEEWLSALVGATEADATDGLSAYQVAVEAGYTGTLEEWLSDLVGPTGATGADGLSAYQVAVEAGYTGTLEEWLSGLVGATGVTGADGLSAYQVAVEAGYTGTLEEWLSGLVGTTGATGADGLSAYQVAVESGYTGTLEEWLSSLVGATGATGADGTQGVTGPIGPTGPSITPAYGIVYGRSDYTLQNAEAVLNNEVYGRMMNTTAQDNGIMIHTAGVYYISYQVNVGPDQNGSFNILFGGIRAAEYHTQFSTNSYSSVVSGGGIVQTVNNNTLVTIINTSGKQIDINSAWGTSNLNVVKIADTQ